MAIERLQKAAGAENFAYTQSRPDVRLVGGTEFVQGDVEQDNVIRPEQWHGSHVALRVDVVKQDTPMGRSDYIVESNGEKRMRNYSAFGQLMIQEGNKIMPVSFPFPLGTSPEMAEEIVQRTLFPDGENRAAAKTFGEKRELRAMEKEDMDESVLELLTRFVDSADKVLDEQHPDKNHRAFKKFKRDQAIRRHNLQAIAQDIEDGLADQDTITTAWSEKNHGKRMFVMGHRLDEKTGKVMGMGPAPEYKEFEVTSLGASAEMTEWLNHYESTAQKFAKEGKEKGEKKRKVQAHVDAGPTVDDCTGSKRCSAYFDAMEEEVSALEYQAIFGFPGQSVTIFNGELLEDGCEKGHKRGKCHCKKASEESDATE